MTDYNTNFELLMIELNTVTACANQAAGLLRWIEAQDNPFKLKKCLTEAYEVLQEAKHGLGRIKRAIDVGDGIDPPTG